MTDQLETTVAALWPDAVVRFYDSREQGCAILDPSARPGGVRPRQPRLRRRAGRAAAAARGLTYRFAIPFRTRRGALIVELPANGEAIDSESVAVALR